jgi:hypothetical protein
VTPEEAKARLEEQKAKLRAMQDRVDQLAVTNTAPVMLAMLRSLVEMVCAADGPNFTLHNKLKFYEGVLLLLQSKGIS